MYGLDFVKPGVKPGQVILAVDLTVAGSIEVVLGSIESLGYTPKIRHISYPSGVHVLAVLKDEQHQTVEDDYLIEEWQQLLSVVSSKAVHLWRGQAQPLANA
ncbi:hypothetical protein C7293_03250 [filamentous cyanobacterium CCT1]|nr:hypothetical protein C7293_03250 [filamentous cyanobacterium CCT1]PSN81374.1 hypothetical protein C8B47_01785 [filamentous cyanobacterium CCP4]